MLQVQKAFQYTGNIKSNQKQINPKNKHTDTYLNFSCHGFILEWTSGLVNYAMRNIYVTDGSADLWNGVNFRE